MTLRPCVKLLVCFVFGWICAFGQNIAGSVVGEVTDSSGSVVPGAEITLRNQDTGVSTKVLTSQAGTYSVSNLPAGQYEVEARANGFRSLDHFQIATSPISLKSRTSAWLSARSR